MATLDPLVRSRLRQVLAGELPADRLPYLEWAGWWDQTVARWEVEGLPAGLDCYEIKRYFGLDITYQHWFDQWTPHRPELHEGAWVSSEAEYEALMPYLYPDPTPFDRECWAKRAGEQAHGEVICWVTLDGFFWWPRVLFGIAQHLYAFYDQPELMHRMNRDQGAYILRCLEQFCEICTPDFVTFAEDMSYNHGPMISRELFEQFMAPYYRQVIPAFKERGITCLIDSDGQVESLVPWFEAVGLEGILPLERMAGVDVSRLRDQHPQWIMIGGYDKTVMHQGEQAMRAEFERLLPVARRGRFVPSVDHQTPPGVSLEDYRLYLRLLDEYMRRACCRE